MDSDGCPTCGFPRGAPGYLRTEYPVGHAKFGAIVACPDCHDGNLSERLRRAAQLTGWLTGASFNGYRVKPGNRAAYDAAQKFAKTPRGWLSLWGTYGLGKTHLLAAVVNECTAQRIGAVYYTLPDLLDKLRDGYSDDGFSGLYERLVNVPVLALDELDKVRLTEWAKEKLYQLCDARYRDRDRRGTLFASNTRPDTADPELGYLASRMADYYGCQVIELAGGDVRPVARAA
jgi:DNA replication protein DnaC